MSKLKALQFVLSSEEPILKKPKSMLLYDIGTEHDWMTPEQKLLVHYIENKHFSYVKLASILNVSKQYLQQEYKRLVAKHWRITAKVDSFKGKRSRRRQKHPSLLP